MDDVFEVLDCVLRSRYRAPEVLPTLPIWERLPTELQSAFATALERCEPLGTIVRLVWQVREELHGKREADRSGEWTRAYAPLRLGLLYLAHQEGRLDTDKLLAHAFHVADSYVCNIDPRPFSLLLREPASSSLATSVAGLFAHYAQVAQQCVERWGLR